MIEAQLSVTCCEFCPVCHEANGAFLSEQLICGAALSPSPQNLSVNKSKSEIE